MNYHYGFFIATIRVSMSRFWIIFWKQPLLWGGKNLILCDQPGRLSPEYKQTRTVPMGACGVGPQALSYWYFQTNLSTEFWVDFLLFSLLGAIYAHSVTDTLLDCEDVLKICIFILILNIFNIFHKTLWCVFTVTLKIAQFNNTSLHLVFPGLEIMY